MTGKGLLARDDHISGQGITIKRETDGQCGMEYRNPGGEATNVSETLMVMPLTSGLVSAGEDPSYSPDLQERSIFYSSSGENIQASVPTLNAANLTSKGVLVACGKKAPTKNQIKQAG